MLRQKKRLLKVLGIGLLILVALGLLGLGVLVLWRLDLSVQPEPETTVTQPPETEPPTEPTTEPTEPPIPLSRFTAEDFAYVDGYLTCITEECYLGLDVSRYQGQIDWQQVREAGFDFVMIRIGYRGYGKEGGLNPDRMAQNHYEGAKAAGLRVGGYFFSQAISTDEAREEALYALELTKDWVLELPIAFDWEYISEEARTAQVDKELLTQCAIAFCQEISDVGRYTMIYVSPWMDKYDLEVLTEYPQWLARYTDRLDYPYDFDMWQYTCTGQVPGVEGDVDLNILFPYNK